MSKTKKPSASGMLTSDSLDTDDVLEGAEPWEPIETKLVLYSFIAAAIVLIIGLFLVPTSILH
ncbi:MAG: hypothetical protein ABIA59_08405 [Candidatus Latescibacterota bacterium]